MNSRERLITSLRHREPDRVPIDLGGTDITHIGRDAYRNLMAFLGRETGPIVIENIAGQCPQLDQYFLNDIIKADTRQIRERNGSRWKLKIEDDEKYFTYISEWGIVNRMPKEEGHYFDMVEHPLKEPTREVLSAFPWPDMNDPVRYQGLKDEARSLYEKTDYGLLVDVLFGGGVFELSQYLRGMGDFLSDLILEPDFADELMERLTEILIISYGNILNEIGPYVQVVAVGDDLGTQNGLLISPNIYRKRIKPRQKRLIESIKSKTDAYILYHTCGAIREFIPDLIEIGVDALNPIQVSARGMDNTAELKRIYGKDLTFWGGLCDNQKVLPFGNPKEVRDETRRRLEDMMAGGGYVAASIHCIQDDVPPENILAMFETVHEYGVY